MQEAIEAIISTIEINLSFYIENYIRSIYD